MAALTFGEKLADLRIKKGMTQKELGEILGVNSRTISAYEANKIPPPFDKLVMIADYFSVSYDYLMRTEAYDNTTTVDFGLLYLIHKNEKYSTGKLYSRLISLSDDERESVLTLLDLLESNQDVSISTMLRAISEKIDK